MKKTTKPILTEADLELLEKRFVTKNDLDISLTKLKSDLFDKIDPILIEV